MSQPLFSIIIPVFNVERYLPDCLESAINQTYKNFEIIIVNDATEDDSERIINTYLHKHASIKYIKLEKNVGLGFSRNVGLKNAQGDYVFFLDADDWIEIDALAKLKAIIEDTPLAEIDLIVFNHQIVHDKKQYPNLSETVYQKHASNSAFITDKQLLFKVFHVAWNKLYRLKFLTQNKLEFPQGAYEDIAFVLKSYSLTENIILTADSLYNYRLREGTPLGGLVKKGHRNDHFVVFSRYQQVFEDLKDKHLPPQMKTQIMQHLLKQCVAILTDKHRLKPDQRTAFAQQAAQLINKYDPQNQHLSTRPYKQLHWLLKNKQFTALNSIAKTKYLINKFKLLG